MCNNFNVEKARVAVPRGVQQPREINDMECLTSAEAPETALGTTSGVSNFSEPKERPILFSGPMVRALLDGRKTQTRRAVKLPTKGEYHRPDMGGWAPGTVGGVGCFDRKGAPVAERACIWNQTTGTTLVSPYGDRGDRLWVRETCSAEEREDGYDGVRYWADEAWAPIENTAAAADKWVTLYNYGRGPRSDCVGPSIPAIHMPRWASRLTLEITGVRVERLNEISEADAKAEGLEWVAPTWGVHGIADSWHGHPAGAYAGLWEHINGPGSWAANPWVWVVEFAPSTSV